MTARNTADSRKSMDDSLIENTAKVVSNKANTPGGPCLKALGSTINLGAAAEQAVKFSEINALINAHLLLNYCLNGGERADVYRTALGDFLNFLTQSKLEANAMQSEEPKKT